jgi:hypothetical protein
MRYGNLRRIMVEGEEIDWRKEYIAIGELILLLLKSSNRVSAKQRNHSCRLSVMSFESLGWSKFLLYTKPESSHR